VLKTTLQINTTLKDIFLEKNKINNIGCAMISDILNSNKYVEMISILGNKVDNDGIDLILERQRKIPIKIISKTDYYQNKLNNQNNNYFQIMHEFF